MKSDIQIQKDIMSELQWQPFLLASQIGVAVKNGIVTLSGHVDSYAKKLAAENAAKKVSGVKAIAEDIQIGVSPSYMMSDSVIAQACVDSLRWNSAVQNDKIRIKVEDGIVKLEGEAEWEYQRVNAVNAVKHLTGVRSVLNLITLKPKVTSTDVQSKISSAFHRSATIDASKITAEVEGSKVILRGKVRSVIEKEDAAIAAWNAPGVLSVVNKLEIETPEFAFED